MNILVSNIQYFDVNYEKADLYPTELNKLDLTLSGTVIDTQNTRQHFSVNFQIKINLNSDSVKIGESKIDKLSNYIQIDHLQLCFN